MFSNALIQRYRFSAFRPQKFWVLFSVYILFVGLDFFINYSLWFRDVYYRTFQECIQSIYFQLFLLQAVLWWIVGVYQSNTAFREEHLAKTYDFFKLLPLSPLQKMIGVIAGRNLLPVFLGLLNLFFLVLLGIYGNLALRVQVQLILLVISVGIMAGLLGFLSNMKTSLHKQQKGLLILLFFFGIGIIPALFSGGFRLFEILKQRELYITFYTVTLPAIYVLCLLSWYFSIWAILGIVRWFKKENEPLLTPLSSLIFFIGFQLILLGLYSPFWEGTRTDLYVIGLISFIPAMLLPAGNLKELEQYHEYLGLLGEKAKDNSLGWGSLFNFSLIPTGLWIFFLWISLLLGSYRHIDQTIRDYSYILATVFSFYLCYLLFLELYVVYKPVTPKAGFLIGFLGLMFVGLPLILSGVFGQPEIMQYSLVGFLFMYPANYRGIVWTGNFGVMIQNLILCLIEVYLICRRYQNILDIRKKMLTQENLVS